MSRTVTGSGVANEPVIRLAGTPSGRRLVDRFSPLADSSGNRSMAGFSSAAGTVSGRGAGVISSAGLFSRNQSITFQPFAMATPPKRESGEVFLNLPPETWQVKQPGNGHR